MASASNFQVTIELAANDKGSKVINLALDKITNKAAAAKMSFDRISKGAFDVAKKAAIVGGLLATPLALGAKSAVEFEDAMAGVGKVTNEAVGGAGLLKLGEQAKGAAVEIGIAADESASLMAALASGGVAKNDLADMTVTAGKVGVAFDLAAKDAGDSFVKMRNALGITNKEAKLAADSFNFISDNDASTAAQILTYMANGGASMARTLSIAAPQAATFGSALISMGKSGEEAATIMLRFQKALYLKGNGDMLKTYKDAGRGAAGLMAVLKAGGSIKDSDKQFAYFQRMGEYGTSVSQLAKSYGTLEKNMGLVAKQSNYEGSVDKEFANRNSTVKGQINKLKAEAGVLAVDLGSTLLPVLRDLVKEAAPLLRQLATWIKANPQLTQQIIKGAAAMSAMSFAVSGVSSAVGVGAKALDILAPAFGKAGIATKAYSALSSAAFSGTFKIYERFPKIGQALFNIGGRLTSLGGIGARIIPMLTGGFQAIGAAVLGITWPVALAIAAIALVGYVIYRNWDKLRPMFVNTWRIIKNISLGIYDTIAYYFGRAGTFLSNTFAPVKSVITWIKNAFASIKMPEWLKSAGSWVSGKLSGWANSSANFANEAAAKRGITRNIQGAVGSPSTARVGGMNTRAIAAAAAVNGGSFAGAVPAAVPGVPAGGGGGNSVTVHYSPKIEIKGGAGELTERQVLEMMRKHPREIAKMVAEGLRQSGRTSLQ